MRRKVSVTTVVLILLVAVLFGFMVYGLIAGYTLSPIDNTVGTVLSPLQRAGSAARQWIVGIFVRADREALQEENEELKGRVLELEAKLQEREAMEQENRDLHEFFSLKDLNGSFDTVLAKVISYDAGNLSGTVTINRGSSSGIAKYDVVMSPGGLVGIVTAVGLNYAKVETILNPDSTVGATVVRTGESGVLKGTYQLKKEGQCELTYLRSLDYVQEGDVVKTSGLGGRYPEGLIIGTVISVTKKEDLTVSAVVQASVDMNTLNNVMVLTHYALGE